jgi:hypothetical protein
MRREAKAIRKWRQKAIFIDFQKTRVTVVDQSERFFRRGNVPASFLEKHTPNSRNLVKVAMRRLSLIELVSGAVAIFCFVVFIYIKMLLFEMTSPQATSMLETYSVLSFIIGITVLVTLATSMTCRRIFSGET